LIPLRHLPFSTDLRADSLFRTAGLKTRRYTSLVNRRRVGYVVGAKAVKTQSPAVLNQ
jgi:hypothetical protein